VGWEGGLERFDDEGLGAAVHFRNEIRGASLERYLPALPRFSLEELAGSGRRLDRHIAEVR
jgi:hypothetical protein